MQTLLTKVTEEYNKLLVLQTRLSKVCEMENVLCFHLLCHMLFYKLLHQLSISKISEHEKDEGKVTYS